MSENFKALLNKLSETKPQRKSIFIEDPYVKKVTRMLHPTQDDYVLTSSNDSDLDHTHPKEID